MADSVGAIASCYPNTKQVQMNMFHTLNSFWAFGGRLMQGINRNGCRRGIWQRVWMLLRFCVSIGLGMLHEHKTSSNEHVSCI